MSSEKCIPIKKKLIDYMSRYYPSFYFEGGNNQFYVFRHDNPDGIYDYIILQKEFYKGILRFVITEVASCYNKSWKGIPWATIGYDADIAGLITGKNRHKAEIGWHECGNHAEELNGLFDEIRNDIDTYVLAFFAKSHEKINADERMVIINSYMQAQFESLSESDIQAIKKYLVDCNKAYCEHRKTWLKSKETETARYFDIIPLHPIVKRWLIDIGEQLNWSNLSEKIRNQIITDTTVLFRDNYNFYDLRL